VPREVARGVRRAPDGSILALVPPIQTKLFGRLQLALDHASVAKVRPHEPRGRLRVVKDMALIVTPSRRVYTSRPR